MESEQYEYPDIIYRSLWRRVGSSVDELWSESRYSDLPLLLVLLLILLKEWAIRSKVAGLLAFNVDSSFFDLSLSFCLESRSREPLVLLLFLPLRDRRAIFSPLRQMMSQLARQ